MTKTNTGFTLVELITVIIVLAILTTIVAISLTNVQKSGRDAQREASVTVIAESLEKYYNQNGEYPSCAAISAPAAEVSAETLLGIEQSALFVPNADSTVTNSIRCGDTLTVGGTNGDFIEYLGDGTVACSGTGACASYTLRYRNEVKNTIKEIASRYHLIATNPALLDCPTGFVTVPGSVTYGTSSFCVMKYEAKNVGSVATSQANNTPWVAINQNDAILAATTACTGCHLLTEEEWMTIAADIISVADNWTNGSVGSGSLFTGHSDNAPSSVQTANSDDSIGYYLTGQTTGSQRRTLKLSNGEVIWDLSGNAAEFTSSSLSGSGTYPGINGQSFQWYEWNNPALVFRSVASTSQPTSASPAAAGWTSTGQGIGRLYTSYGASNPSAYVRGGSYAAGSTSLFSPTDAGVFSLWLGFSPTSTSSGVGFRAAVTP